MANDDNGVEGTGLMTEPTPASTGQLHLDLYKHLTTLSAGSLVLIATFLKDIFPRNDGQLNVPFGIKLLIGTSLVSLGISLLSSVYFMLRLSNQATVKDRESAVLDFLNLGSSKGWQVTASLAFLAGLFCFGLAVVLNLFG